MEKQKAAGGDTQTLPQPSATIVNTTSTTKGYTISTPYETQALQYLESGLGYPIPSAYPYEKFPPLTGWTGARGAIPTWEQVEAWTRHYSDSNILLRMAPDVIGIDVDDYDGKHGAQTIHSIEDHHGEMVRTHASTARLLPSGIYYYRLRPWMDTSKMRDPGEHVEVIRFEHRYAVCPPSWHSGVRARYRWSEDVTPQKGDLAWLPTEWYVHLTRSCECFEEERQQRRYAMRRFTNRRPGEAGVGQAQADLLLACEALRHTAEGSRNNLLSSIAGRVYLYDVVSNEMLSWAEATQTMGTAAINAGLPPHEAKRTLESAWDWATREGKE